MDRQTLSSAEQNKLLMVYHGYKVILNRTGYLHKDKSNGIKAMYSRPIVCAVLFLLLVLCVDDGAPSKPFV